MESTLHALIAPKVRELASSRTRLDELKQELQARQEEFKQQNARLIALVDEARNDAEQKREAVEAAAVEAYEQTGDKRVTEGVSIALRTKYAYDEDEALAFAAEKGLFLKLDKKGFEGWLKTGPNEFPYEEQKTPSVRIARDLDKELSAAATNDGLPF